MASKMKLEFDGFDEVVSRLKKLDGNVKTTSEEALKKSKRFVHEQIGSAMNKHNRTHRTIKSLDSYSDVEWSGSVGTISVGFDLSKGGMPSIFLMYGTPKMKKDQQLYNAVYGKATQAKVREIQEEAFYDAIRRLE